MGSNNGRPLKAYVEEVQDEYDAAMAMRNRETSTQKDVLLEAQVESASKPSIMEQIADGQRREAVERKAVNTSMLIPYRFQETTNNSRNFSKNNLHLLLA